MAGKVNTSKRTGRPAKAIPYQYAEVAQAWMNANMAAHQGMPSNPDHQALIIGALMERIKDRDPSLHEHCRRSIASIANLETCRFASADRIKEEIGRELYNIIDGKIRRLTHAPYTLRQQRGALIDYLTKEEYPNHANNTLTRTHWIGQHWARMIAICAPVHCFCQHYNAEHDSLVQTAKKARKTVAAFRTRSEIAVLIVAHLHTISPAQAHKLLKTPL
jgi:hypothetical protein